MTSLPFLDWSALPPDLRASRILLGSEICAGRLPDDEELALLLAELDRRALDAGWVLPPCAPPDLDRVRVLLPRLVAAKASGACEVVCNDWGCVALCARIEGVEPVLGRLLVPQALDPRFGREEVFASLGEEDGREVAAPLVDPARLDDLRALGVRRLSCSWVPWLRPPRLPADWVIDVWGPVLPMAHGPTCLHGRLDGDGTGPLVPFLRCARGLDVAAGGHAPCRTASPPWTLGGVGSLQICGNGLFARRDDMPAAVDWADRMVSVDAPR